MGDCIPPHPTVGYFPNPSPLNSIVDAQRRRLTPRLPPQNVGM
ncbi:hypothetical protein [Nostoc parmelioides]|nr:hypothetical protein [Nostoc parmelioides]